VIARGHEPAILIEMEFFQLTLLSPDDTNRSRHRMRCSNRWGETEIVAGILDTSFVVMAKCPITFSIL
jgi:hypothetical protein